MVDWQTATPSVAGYTVGHTGVVAAAMLRSRCYWRVRDGSGCESPPASGGEALVREGLGVPPAFVPTLVKGDSCDATGVPSGSVGGVGVGSSPAASRWVAPVSGPVSGVRASPVAPHSLPVLARSWSSEELNARIRPHE